RLVRPHRDLSSLPTRRSSDLEKLLLHTDALRLPDDRYTLRLSMQDQAGNRSEQTLAFQVNRHGSQFSLSQEPFVIQERNVSQVEDRKSTRLNSSHVSISYAVF